MAQRRRQRRRDPLSAIGARRVSIQNLVDACDQIHRQQILEHEGRRSPTQSFCPHIGIVECRQHNDLRVGPGRPDLWAKVQPTGLRHREIEDEYLRGESLHRLEHLAPRAHLADDLTRFVKRTPQRPEDPGVVVGQQYSWSVCLRQQS